MSARLITDPRLRSAELQSRARQQLSEGLTARPASIPCSYLYDALGSLLFAAITELPEYYPTRTEAALMSRHAAHIARLVSATDMLVDLGAGDCKKGARLLSSLPPADYLAIDVSRDCLVAGAQAVARDFPGIAVTAYVTDFSSGVQWPDGMRCERPLFFYPGSSIGNFSPDDAQRFLRGLAGAGHKTTEERLLLAGVDLVKPVPMLEAAYADALGLTACFNLNLLRNVNQALGADFDVRQFRHRAVFDHRHSRIEMSLVSQRAQMVCWPGARRHFDKGELIITEHSYKYTIPDADDLLHSSGFEMLHRWTDDDESYLLCIARSVC